MPNTAPERRQGEPPDRPTDAIRTHDPKSVTTGIDNWRDLSEDPNAPAVQAYLRATLRAARQPTIADVNAFLLDFVRDQTVLDIGIVAHTIEQADDPRWRHNRIRSVAASTLGIDILAAPIAQLQRRGYDVRLVDATSDTDLQQRFNRVVIGDVLEHVDNPVALLRFAGRHLAPTGRVLCSTPNPFYIGHIVSTLRAGTFIANAEHVTWITPTMALELARRAGLRLFAYWHTRRTGGTVLNRLGAGPLRRLGLLDHEMATRTFVYAFGHA